MITNKNAEKCLWMLAVMLVTYLFIGSFIVSKDFCALFYLIVLYSFLIIIKIYERKGNV